MSERLDRKDAKYRSLPAFKVEQEQFDHAARNGIPEPEVTHVKMQLFEKYNDSKKASGFSHTKTAETMQKASHISPQRGIERMFGGVTSERVEKVLQDETFATRENLFNLRIKLNSLKNPSKDAVSAAQHFNHMFAPLLKAVDAQLHEKGFSELEVNAAHHVKVAQKGGVKL